MASTTALCTAARSSEVSHSVTGGNGLCASVTTNVLVTIDVQYRDLARRQQCNELPLHSSAGSHALLLMSMALCRDDTLIDYIARGGTSL